MTDLHVAENGQQGLELYREKRPDIILSDIMMPVMNGLEMTREIRKLDRDSQVIMLTAYSDTDYLLECISLGINQYVQKPVDFDQPRTRKDPFVADMAVSIDHLFEQVHLQSISGGEIHVSPFGGRGDVLLAVPHEDGLTETRARRDQDSIASPSDAGMENVEILAFQLREAIGKGDDVVDQLEPFDGEGPL